ALSTRGPRTQQAPPAASEPTVVPAATENVSIPLEAAQPPAEQLEAVSRLEPPVVTPSRAMEVESDQAPLSTRSRAIIVVLLGWGVAAVAFAWFASLEFTAESLFGAHLVWTGLAGVSTALALRWIEPRVNGEHLALLVAGWLIAGLVSAFVVHQLVVNENYPTDLFFVSALINVSLGGLVTAVAVRLIFPRAPMQQLGLIVAAWIVAAIVTGIGLSQIKDSA